MIHCPKCNSTQLNACAPAVYRQDYRGIFWIHPQFQAAQFPAATWALDCQDCDHQFEAPVPEECITA